jgi:dTDP-4-amino-4,6-dideoxygalactose transaminase
MEPKASYIAHQEEINVAIQRVLDSGRYILGEEVENFEREFASYLGVRYAIGVGSGTDALQIALRACGIEEGDWVISVSHTAVATIASIDLVGAVPVLVDVNPRTYTIDLNLLEDTIKTINKKTSKLKAIIPVHLYGHPCDMLPVMDLAARHGLYVIEDCAQSHGATIYGQKTGTWGHLSAFSFYPTKNLGALGDGGAVVTNDDGLARRARLIREYGWEMRYKSEIRGMNSRLDELQAAVLRVKLKYLDAENDLRRKVASEYNSLLNSTSLKLPRVSPNVQHVYHQYVVRSRFRDELRAFLAKNGITALIHYPIPVHLQPAYEGCALIGTGGLGVTEKVCKEVLSLPIGPQITSDQVKLVSEIIHAFETEGKNIKLRER